MSHDMNNDPFADLNKIEVPEADAGARERAMAAGLAAFEAASTQTAKKNSTRPQGNEWGRRLMAIITSLKGNSIMDIRIPLGTAAIAILLVPLGYQLYSSTALTGQAKPNVEAETQELAAPLRAKADDAANNDSEKKSLAVKPAPVPVVVPEPAPQAEASARELAHSQQGAVENFAVSADVSNDVLGGIAREAMPLAAPMPSTVAMAPMLEPSGDEFANYDESRLQMVAEAPVSTFSIDVDTASYSYVRRQLEDGVLPQPDAVRIEEMLNYFPYDYPAPQAGEAPFKADMAIYPTPWNAKTQLLQIGIKGYAPPIGETPAVNLVFLIDTSGSMNAPDKLPLLKRAFGLLVDQLSAQDSVSIVTYAGSAGVVLPPTKANQKSTILAALDGLAAGGGTAGAQGIELAYQLAQEHKLADGTNRVILATDGDFNVGIDDPEDLKTYIKSKRAAGISLSVLGFGRGNLDDATMQSLAQNGDGNASYIGDFKEAQKVLVSEIGANLQTIAQDVKIQVEFNPAMVSEYRLIGYESRALKREDFNNDAVDAGDIGAGHRVTALYEITPVGSGSNLVDPLRYGAAVDHEAVTPAATAHNSEIAFLKMRYKVPGEAVSQLLEQAVRADMAYEDISLAPDDMRFAAAVAAFGQKLKDSDYGQMDWAAIKALAQGARGADVDGYRAEFIGLINSAAALKPAATSAK